jgi:hypothetical protein
MELPEPGKARDWVIDLPDLNTCKAARWLGLPNVIID